MKHKHNALRAIEASSQSHQFEISRIHRGEPLRNHFRTLLLDWDAWLSDETMDRLYFGAWLGWGIVGCAGVVPVLPAILDSCHENEGLAGLILVSQNGNQPHSTEAIGSKAECGIYGLWAVSGTKLETILMLTRVLQSGGLNK